MRVFLIIIAVFSGISIGYPAEVAEKSNSCYKRASGNSHKTIDLDLQMVSTGVYITKIYVGTPPQPVDVGFDTGSSDSWVKVSSNGCKKNQCASGISFLPNESKGFHSLYINFSMVYGTGDVSGFWATDDYNIKGYSVSQFRFGTVTSENSLGFDYGLIGLGLEKFESTYTFEYGITNIMQNTYDDNGPKYTYPNFLTRLKNNGYINTRSYSIFFPNQGDSDCRIIFGGVDLKKYNSLMTIPIIQRSSGDWAGYTEAVLLAVGLDQIYAQYNGLKYPILVKSYPALLDTLSYYTYAPLSAILNLATLLGGTYDAQSYGIEYSCNGSLQISFSFSGELLQLPLDSMAIEEVGVCFFPITESNDDYLILGSKFLSNVYSFFDLDNLQVSMGNYKDSISSYIQDVKGAPPGSFKVPNYSSTFFYSSEDQFNISYSDRI